MIVTAQRHSSHGLTTLGMGSRPGLSSRAFPAPIGAQQLPGFPQAPGFQPSTSRQPASAGQTPYGVSALYGQWTAIPMKVGRPPADHLAGRL